MRSIMRYPGSKWAIAQWIVSHFPEGYEKMVYLEPFAGSAAVFFTKNPGAVETINDLDGDIVNLFQVLREQPGALSRVIELTPFSREEYDRAFEPCVEPLEKARRFMVKTNQAIGAKRDGKCGWHDHKSEKVGGTACYWHGIPGALGIAAERLRGSATNLVQIEHMDALRLMERYDKPEVLMYLDPPYVMGTRRSGRLYRHEMDDATHKRMLEIAVNSQAKIILSGYTCELYDNALKGWRKDSVRAAITSGEKAEECIWMNYEPPFQKIRMMDIKGDILYENSN